MYPAVGKEGGARGFLPSASLTTQTAAMPSSAFERLLDAQAEEMLASMERIKERRRTQAVQPPPSALSTQPVAPPAAARAPTPEYARPRRSASTPRTRTDGSPRPTPGHCAPTLQTSKTTPHSPLYSPRPPSTPQTRASVAEMRAARLWQACTHPPCTRRAPTAHPTKRTAATRTRPCTHYAFAGAAGWRGRPGGGGGGAGALTWVRRLWARLYIRRRWLRLRASSQGAARRRRWRGPARLRADTAQGSRQGRAEVIEIEPSASWRRWGRRRRRRRRRRGGAARLCPDGDLGRPRDLGVNLGVVGIARRHLGAWRTDGRRCFVRPLRRPNVRRRRRRRRRRPNVRRRRRRRRRRRDFGWRWAGALSYFTL